MREFFSLLFIYVGIFFVAIGVLGFYRCKNFYTRILVTANVDATGFIFILLGVIIRHGFSFFSLKVFFVIVFALIINPLITHAITRSAYNSGYKIKRE